MYKVSVALLLPAFAILLAGRVQAHEGHAHKAKGVVKAVDANHIEVETKDGEKVSIDLDKETKYFRGESPAAHSDVKAGNRVVVAFMEKGGKNMAREVRLGSAKPGAAAYTCSMHPEVVADKPGTCPKCGMELVPKK